MSGIPKIIQQKLDADASKRGANAERGRKNDARGKVVQDVFLFRLRALGLVMVERIETGWMPQRVKGRIIGAKPMAKVAGDFRAIVPGGLSVLVEVKYRPGSLLYSALADHQLCALNEHARYGGLSLLGWAWHGGNAVMRWPVPGFVPRSSISRDQATILNLQRIG